MSGLAAAMLVAGVAIGLIAGLYGSQKMMHDAYRQGYQDAENDKRRLW